MSSKITCICGNNKYRDNFIYGMICEYGKTGIYKFGAVIGNIYPYYKYFSDNMYIKYDEQIMEDYIDNLISVYKKQNGEIDRNILIVDSNLIDLNSKSWEHLLDKYQIYKTDIIIVIDKIMEYNIEKLNKYVNVLHLIRQVYYRYNYIDNIYKTFFVKKFDKDMFVNIYEEHTSNMLYVMMCDLDKHNYYRYIINTECKLKIFNTYKIYDQKNIYKQRCVLSDIINI